MCVISIVAQNPPDGVAWWFGEEGAGSGFVLITLSRPESHGSSVGAHFDDPSRAPIARSAPRLFTSTTPGVCYKEY
ncbi:hypothetical protein TNCV_3277411 [Trichonephila clavipes]|nr:hypothetical protein TNCV_3277411 [Trichonephila clavipes]